MEVSSHCNIVGWHLRNCSDIVTILHSRGHFVGGIFLVDFGAEHLKLEVIASELTGSGLTQKCQEGCMTFSASTNPQHTWSTCRRTALVSHDVLCIEKEAVFR